LSASITMAHELGHYLSLEHPEYMDICDDNPSWTPHLMRWPIPHDYLGIPNQNWRNKIILEPSEISKAKEKAVERYFGIYDNDPQNLKPVLYH
jgi:hypothetical protein